MENAKIWAFAKTWQTFWEPLSYRPICLLDTAEKILEGWKDRLALITNGTSGILPNPSQNGSINGRCYKKSHIQIGRKITNKKRNTQQYWAIIRLGILKTPCSFMS